jgi:hypothetical protein
VVSLSGDITNLTPYWGKGSAILEEVLRRLAQ